MGKGRELREIVGEQMWDEHTERGEIVPLEFTEEVNPNLFGIESATALKAFSGLVTVEAERDILIKSSIKVLELEINTVNLPIFEELSRKWLKNRTQGYDLWKKGEKDFSLKYNALIDAKYNKEILEGKEIEAKLLDAEKFFERQQAEATAKLNTERIALVEPYLESVIGLDLTTMDEYIFESFLEGAKAKFHAVIEANCLAELQRIADAKAEANRIEAQRLENLELRAKAEADAKKNKAEKIEREKLAKIESDKLAKERAENARILQEANNKIKAKIDAETKAENERIAKVVSDKKEADKLAKAPIKSQLTNWVNQFEIPATTSTHLTSIEIVAKFESFKKWAKLEIKKL